MCSVPSSLFLSTFFHRAFLKAHSDSLQGIWEFTIYNFKIRELNLESVDQE